MTIANDTQQLNEQDYELIRLIMEEGWSKEKAVDALQYPAKTKAGKIQTANRIIRNYTSQASSRDIFRQSGINEQLLAQKLREILDTGSNSDKLKAIDIASKCLGLHKDTITDGGAIIQINFADSRAPDFGDGDRTQISSTAPSIAISS